MRKYTRYEVIKRAVDVSLAVLGLLASAPLALVTALIIRMTSPGPVLYRGMRVGRNGRLFAMLKFRTMVTNAESLGGSATAEDDPRITPVGRFLRRYKLDELPQLFNVLRGDMSVVGPRPEVEKYVSVATPAGREILSVLPGITDWASIWNSNEAAVLEGSRDPEKTYEELIRPTKIALQLVYVRERSTRTDLAIITHTVAKLLDENWIPGKLKPYGKVRTYRMTSESSLRSIESPVSDT